MHAEHLVNEVNEVNEINEIIFLLQKSYFCYGNHIFVTKIIFLYENLSFVKKIVRMNIFMYPPQNGGQQSSCPTRGLTLKTARGVLRLFDLA